MTPDEAKWICYDAMASKCKAGKAFSVIGILALVGAMIGAAANYPRRKLVTYVSAGIAIFSFMMVWALWAALYNGEDPGFIKPGRSDPNWRDSDTDACGLNGPENEYVSYGAAFGLYVTAWLLAIAGTLLFHFAKRGDGVANPYSSRQIDNRKLRHPHGL